MRAPSPSTPRLALPLAAALLAGALAALAAPAPAADDEEVVKNGFALGDARVPADEIVEGGPPRDGIKSVDAPSFVSHEESETVEGRTPVHGLVVGDAARVYPEHVMEYHQIVNDAAGGRPIVATYDPLTGVPAAYGREVEGRTLTFGVSGLLYNHSFLLYDRETESLWVQFTGEAIAGPLAGERLPELRMRRETLDIWLARHPHSRVLERPFPDKIDYRVSQYETYWVQDEILFPVKAKSERFHAKELVLGVTKGDEARAYLGSLATKGGGEVVDTFQGSPVRFVYDTDLGVFSWEIPEDLRVREGYWFAWKAFHPDTEVWRPEGGGDAAPGAGLRGGSEGGPGGDE